MTLIKSISGIRGTIGGKPGEGLTPIDTVKFASAFGMWIKEKSKSTKPKMVIGRDARLSGRMIQDLVSYSLLALGIDVIDVDLATTPTVEMMVTETHADGGIILTASHNPKQWNALKLLNNLGEFISGADGELVLQYAENESFVYADIDQLGTLSKKDDALNIHIDKVLADQWVDVAVVKNAKFKVVVDAVNSVGGIAIPELLKKMGVECVPVHCEPTGNFAHNPEPLPQHLTDLIEAVKSHEAHLGIAVDPDVDRLALVCEDGTLFGEEYTLVAVADFILQHTKGNTVSNLSSTRALRDVTEKHGGKYTAAAVGEVNVVTAMKSTNAVIGGEGNGGIIYPPLHFGRDALIGVALFLTHLAKSGKTCSQLRAIYPPYFMSKNKVELTPQINTDNVLFEIQNIYKNQKDCTINTLDGVKIDFATEWVHLRKSNTEPIIRIYTEAPTQKEADVLAEKMLKELKTIAGI